MSFVFELQVNDLSDEQADAVEAMCRRSDAWPVLTHQRRRFFGLVGGSAGRKTLYIPDALDAERHILTDDAMWDAEAWAMEPSLVPLLAHTIRLLGEALPQGFCFRATWVGSEVRAEVVLSAEELADFVSASRLNEFTRYTVPGRSQT